MSDPIEEPVYAPPERSICELIEYPVDMGEGHSLLVRQHIYKGKIVDFAIMQYFDDNGSVVQIARIDCCHGMVHRHVFDRDGNDTMDHQELKRIDASQDPWATVDAEFGPCWDRMTREFVENHRRWAK